jgi:hypothetical protein
LLCEHPDIFIPAIKEPNFFVKWYGNGRKWYESLFDEASEHQLWGDGSTGYTTSRIVEESCRRIVKDFPKTRFIFIARHPVKRLESSFREFHHSGYKVNAEASCDIDSTLRSIRHMVPDTRYWTLINIYRARVPDDRILVLFLEDLKRDPAGELRKCFAFLGVDEHVPIKGLARQLNAGSTKYFDTKLMRLIRHNRFGKWCMSRFSHEMQHELGRRLGLRKPFALPIEWPPATRQWLREALGDEIKNFLEFYGKPEEFWGFESWVNDRPSRDQAAA